MDKKLRNCEEEKGELRAENEKLKTEASLVWSGWVYTYFHLG